MIFKRRKSMNKIYHSARNDNESKPYVEVHSDDLLVQGVQDILDLISTLQYQDQAQGILIRQENISPDFFQLSTGVAGEVLQKASNYGFRIGILGDFARLESKALRDFIRESNRYKQVVFGKDPDEVIALWN
jgi:hypothetical protein